MRNEGWFCRSLRNTLSYRPSIFDGEPRPDKGKSQNGIDGSICTDESVVAPCVIEAGFQGESWVFNPVASMCDKCLPTRELESSGGSLVSCGPGGWFTYSQETPRRRQRTHGVSVLHLAFASAHALHTLRRVAGFLGPLQRRWCRKSKSSGKMSTRLFKAGRDCYLRRRYALKQNAQRCPFGS